MTSDSDRLESQDGNAMQMLRRQVLAIPGIVDWMVAEEKLYVHFSGPKTADFVHLFITLSNSKIHHQSDEQINGPVSPSWYQLQ